MAIPAGTNWLGSRAGREGEQPRLFRCAGFWLAETEVTVAQFVAYLNDAGVATADFPQVSGLGGKWRARGSGEEPMANLSWPDAEAYVTWLGARLGRVVRVPTEDEWEYAARAGVDGAPFPWGWEAAEGRARFAGSGPASVKQYAPHRWGVYDLAGNVAEWCAGGTCSRGGSWSDRSSEALRVFHRIPLPAGYRDADTGLRPLLER